MAAIRVLSDNVANQIAAGEVVERPMSVIKELLENAIDAGATRINISFCNGGRSSMSIEDNGCGMSEDQALLALERHATSKIRETEDLDTVRTFGFRGEALPSVASVSKFTLRTKTADAPLGTEIFVNGGKYISCRETGMAQGTKIDVENLFHNVPARLKFLKSENTEAAHITRAIRLYAVAHPKIAFTLWENGREIFRSPANLDTIDRVGAIWGRQLADDLMPLAPAEAAGMKISGLIGKPGVSRTSRQEMVTIVNGRPVDNRTMAYSLVESYHTLIPRGRYPLAFLFLDIDPHAIDVNVHPAKREIRFRDESRVRNFIITAVLNTLTPMAAPEDEHPVPAENSRAPEIFETASPLPTSVNSNEGNSEKPNRSPRVNFPAPSQQLRTSPANTAVPAPRVNPIASSHQNFKNWKFLARLSGDNLALFQVEDGIILLNLRFAHERIWFEKILSRFAADEHVSQQLLIPEPIEFDPILADALTRNLKVVNGVGFDIEEFGRNFFRIRAIPDWLDTRTDVKAFVRDLVSRIARLPAEFSRENVAHETLAKLAGAHAAQSFTQLGEAEIKALLSELFSCKQPNVNPNGQKIFVDLTRSEIMRKFGIF